MLLTRRAALSGGLLYAMSACTSSPAMPKVPTRPITLVSAFQGRRTGEGQFRIWLTGAERRFTATLNGRVTGVDGQRKLTVTEDFVYDDGQKDRLTWVFREISLDQRWYRQPCGDSGCGRSLCDQVGAGVADPVRCVWCWHEARRRGPFSNTPSMWGADLHQSHHDRPVSSPSLRQWQ
jgi:hypothetical protein